MKKPVQFSGKAFKEYGDWSETDFDIFAKIKELITDIQRDFFKGLGKPEPLKGDLQGYWSRRINSEHRLIYKVEKDVIHIYSCHGHY